MAKLKSTGKLSWIHCQFPAWTKALIVGVLALVMGQALMADTFYSKGATGDPTQLTSWTNSANANPANFTGGDTFVILSGCNFTIPFNTSWTVNATTAGTAATLQINSGGTLTFTLSSGSTCKLFLGGNLVRSGTIAGTATSTTGTIEFTSDGAWTGSGDISGVKASVQVDAGVTLDASGLSAGFKLKSSNTVGITVNGTLNIGTFTINGNGNSGAYFTLGASGTLITATTSANGVPGIFTGFSAGKITLPTTANYTFNGTAAQVTGLTANNATMPAQVNNLTVNNAAGITLSQPMEVDGTLVLTAGIVKSNVTLGGSATISGGGSTAYINGQLTVPFSAPSSVSFTFPIGTASGYSPITLANFTDTGSDSLTASATVGQNPNQSSSGIDSSLYVARYWTLADNGGFSSPTYDFTGTYVPSDLQNGANPANLIVRKWNGSSWAAPASSSSAAYTVTGTGFSGSFGQFAAGEPQTTMPVLDSTTKAAITNTSATLGATLENDFSLPVTEYGIVWSTSPSPTTANNKVVAGSSLTPPSAFATAVTGLPVATTIYYRGYAINSTGTGYTTNDSFITLTNEPTVQASGVNISARQNGDLFISWLRGNGARCIALAKSGSAVDSDPVDGVTYTANVNFGNGSQIGAGNYVAYLGTGTNVQLTGLAASTTYYVAVYELNGAGGSENYLAPAAIGSQTTVANPVSLLTWNGNADTDWNNTNNWDALQVPDVGTAVIISSGAGNQPVYSNEMAAASIGTVADMGSLTINTNGFNSGALFVSQYGGVAQLTVNSGGAANVAGALGLCSNAIVTLSAGGVITVSGNLNIGSDTAGGNAGTATVNGYGSLTNLGGTLSAGATYLNPKNASITSGCRLVIAGGVNNLGSVSVQRSSAGSGGYSALGSEGLLIYDGTVNMSGLNVGGGSGNSFLTAWIAGGIVTNKGSVQVNQGSSARGSRFLQTGGLFVVTNLVNPNPTVSGSLNVYSVTGGTNIVGGVYFGNGANAGNIYFTNGATMYVGSQGIASNGAATVSAVLSGGSLIGATADWTGSAAMQMDVGTVTFNAADLNGTPHNITLSAALSGAGGLTKTGNGTLTLGTANTFTGNTAINAGTLALGASGSLISSSITLAGGTTFDVSAVTGGYTLPAGKTLAGFGSVSGNVAVAATAIVSPGTNAANGTLMFLNGLTETGGVVNHFDLSDDPTGLVKANDAITVAGDLNASGANTIEVAGSLPNGGVYTLIQYGGSFNGALANFTLTGVTGTLSNNATAKTISLIAAGTVRSPTNVVWVGNSASNNWDTIVTTNWWNNGALDYFVAGDNVRFDDRGSAHPSVNIIGNETPGSVTVDSAGNYFFSGGSINGTGGLTKTNTGTLSLLNTNGYTGPTVIAGGTLEAITLGVGGVASSLGAASSDTNNLVFAGGSLRYLGANTTSDRGANFLTNATLDVAGAGTTLTLSGLLTGSGALTKVGPGALVLSAGNSYGGGTVISNGTLQLNIATAVSSGTVTNFGDTLKFGGAMIVGNVVDFENNCTVDLSNAGGDTALDGAWTGSGNVTVINQQNSARTFTVGGNGSGGGNLDGFSGTLSMGTNSGFLRFNDSGGSPNLGSTGMTVDLGTGSATLLARNGGITINLGALRGGPATRVTGRGSGSSGTLSYSIGGNNLSTAFAGSITDSANPTAITKVGTGTLTLSGLSSYTGATTINDGILQVDGTNTASIITVAGGTLAGIGTISSSVDVQGNSGLAPGDASIGQLTINNSLTLESGSTNIMELNHNTGTNDNVTGLSSISYGGTLVLTNLAGTLANGDKFVLFTAGSYSGAFDAIVPATPGNGLAWNTDNLSVDGSISVTAPIKPAFGSITISGTDIILTTTNGSPGAQVIVLTSTNLAAPLSAWTPLTTNTFDATTGEFNYTNSGALNSGARQQYYIFQTQ